MDLLNSIVSSTIEKLNNRYNNEINNRNFSKAKEFIDTNEGLIDFLNKVRVFIDDLDKLEKIENEEIEQLKKFSNKNAK
ncbi:hypothetical protein [Clostridium massiliamazoniense]|uniref:hypothetical protein n=1 Tax=Clostridium massiliamazoniense TaxID=1347366 RepID=UPI0006D857BB|nr:hypothetical protein [Clostridium massiliamazoniense]